MKDCKQIAAEWGLSERTVSALCKSGKINGVRKPADSGRFLMMQRNHQMEGFLQESM